jgi:hypothetical protein
MESFKKFMSSMVSFKKDTEKLAGMILEFRIILNEAKVSGANGLKLAADFVIKPGDVIGVMLAHPEHCIEISSAISACSDNYKVVKALKEQLDQLIDKVLHDLDELVVNDTNLAHMNHSEISDSVTLLLREIGSNNKELLDRLEKLMISVSS